MYINIIICKIFQTQPHQSNSLQWPVTDPCPGGWVTCLIVCLAVCRSVRQSGSGSGDIAAVPPGYSALLGLL